MNYVDTIISLGFPDEPIDTADLNSEEARELKAIGLDETHTTGSQ